MLLCHLWPFVALCRGERCEGEGVGARLPSWGGLGPIAASDWKEGEGGPCRAMQGPCRAPPGLGGGCMAPLIEPHLDGGLTALCPPHVRVLTWPFPLLMSLRRHLINLITNRED